jgi:3-methyladenine DNA glycosylase AlkD
MADTDLNHVMGALRELEDPRARAVNEKRGDDHAVNLSKLRALARRLGTSHELAGELWDTTDSAARLPPHLAAAPFVWCRPSTADGHRRATGHGLTRSNADCSIR